MQQHSKTEQALQRYEALYPRLVKQKIKETGIGGKIQDLMQTITSASRQSQQELISKYLSTQQRLQMIHTIAKSEILSPQLDESFWQSLCSEVDKILHSESLDDRDHFICCLFVLTATKMQKQSEITLLLSNLMTRSGAYLTRQLQAIQATEEASEIEVSLQEDKQLQEQMDFILFLVRKGVVKQCFKSGSSLQIDAVFLEATLQLQTFIAEQKNCAYVQLTQFAPFAIWFDVLYEIFWEIKQAKNENILKQSKALPDLLKVTFDVLMIYKTNSQYYMVTIGSVMSKQNNSQTGEQTTTQPAVRRQSKLFAEILDLLVTFMAVYLVSVPLAETSDSTRIFQLLIRDGDGSSFTLIERLRMQNELNFLFQKIPEVYTDSQYWQLIREGLFDVDQSCRKTAINILKSNLNYFQEHQQPKLKCNFENLWTIFFDIYDTLESFGSHLTKAVWHRTELFYDFIQQFSDVYSSGQPIEPLEDMRMWLLVIYHRVASHNNIKVRRFVQKATLKRQFITQHMTEFFFNEFIAWLNQCLIFKDVNNYTQFSKNAHTVIDFYTRYFTEESKDLAKDLKHFFCGFRRNQAHSQMSLICLKVLSQDYPGDLKWITSAEIRQAYDMVNEVSFNDQVLSSKYLCQKYMVRMIANHIAPEVDDYSILFKLIGQMPLEFFTSRTIMDDTEARTSVVKILGKIDLQLKPILNDYLKTLFSVKAMSVTIPKFGKDTDLILQGITRVLLTYPDLSFLQLHSALESFDQMLQSTYLQTKLVEQKVRYFTSLTKTLQEYGTPAAQIFAKQLFVPRAGTLLQRFLDQLCIPLARDSTLLVSEHEKVEAVLSQLQTYADIAGLAVQIVHLSDGVQDNALDSFIKHVLTKSVWLTQKDFKPKTGWSAYLLQLATLEMMQALMRTYAHGITQSVKLGKSQVFIQDDLFVIGKVLLQNLLEFQVNVRPNGDELITKDQEHFMTELGINPSKINQKNSLNVWRILAHLVQIFQYDQQLRQELSQVWNPLITKKTINFLDATTPDYNPHLFLILKLTFVPTVVLQLTTNDDQLGVLEEYQHVVRQCWLIVKQQRSFVEAEELVQFLELSFSTEILEIYQGLPQNVFNCALKFHNQVAKEMVDYGNKYWLIMRSFFNHMMFMFAGRPHLMRGLEEFVLGFGTTRECRSLDAELKLHRLQTMLPELMHEKYDSLPMEQITYQGAYIRAMTLIILEGIINNYISSVSQGTNALRVQWTGEALTKMLLSLLDEDRDRENRLRSDMPFSEPHRIKIRTWQLITILQKVIDDPNVHPAPSTLKIINDTIWPILKQNHLANVRQYMECFTIKFVMRYPELTLNENSKFYDTCLDIQNSKPQLSASLLMCAGYILLYTDPANCTAFKRKIFDRLVGYSGSNSAHCRSIAQYFIMKLAEKEPALIGTALQPLMHYMAKAKDVQKMKEKYQVILDSILYKCMKLEGAAQILTFDMSPEGEHIGPNLIEELMKMTTELMTWYRHEDEIPIERKDWWKHDLAERRKKDDFNVQINEESSNYQRKILPWEYVEYNVTQNKRIIRRKRNEIILCAALIDKIPNLAGLARTCEIMNASSLIMNNAALCKTEEFKGISVTSEKWLPIYEVQERDLLEWLTYQKSNGYQIVGIEQTANSKMLHDFKFPTRCVLLLGKEKEGIPQEYYSVLDHCVEIPQFGIIRSLNVHVSGALCLWEYTKQHMPAQAPSTQTNQL